MFLGLPSFFSFLEGATFGLTFSVTLKNLQTTRAAFPSDFFPSVDMAGPVLICRQLVDYDSTHIRIFQIMWFKD